MSAEKLESEAAAQLAAVLNLPPAGGTARNLIDAIVRAAVARAAESTAPAQQSVGAFAGNDDPAHLAANHNPAYAGTQQPGANFDQQRAKLGLPRRDRK